MATLILRDDVLRARPVEDNPDLGRAIRTLPSDQPLVLRIEGRPLRFRKVVDAATGHPTDGVRPEPVDAEIWHDLQSRRGSMITVEPERPMPDPYLLSLSATLTEWNSPDDAAAYDGL
ncbi:MULTISPECIES: hypothetical protein [unclassified Methylobacterium]|jgi:hypothetical protein|uniref:hypothetical protein n=1 Tax=unclassified Methylobacterium TaxID=2615210 RepID=UPI001354CBA0|nr:hypothetical protein [Methylobacterium sp. 2A]MWV21613.1 hypothetical protein [Methylobacterium sp. 2A]